MTDNFNMNFATEEDAFQGFDDLVKYLKENTIDTSKLDVQWNDKRLEQMQFCYSVLKLSLKDQDVEVTYELGGDFKTIGVIRVEGDEFVFNDPKWFARIVEFADNLEVYPLVNGGIRMGIMFYDVAAYVR